MVRAALAGIGLALATGPLGCFVVWRRMAFFGDAVAHAAILGVALSLAMSLPTGWGVLVSALAMGWLVSLLAGRGFGSDTALGVLAHSALALGLVAASVAGGTRLDLSSYLFGDILAVTWTDLAWIWAGAAATAGLLAWRWRALLAATLNPDLAHASGVEPKREQAALVIGLALVVAISIKIVGALLIGALLIIPAAAARGVARTPEGMAAIAAAIGVFATIAGLAASYHWDTPAGPSIVSAVAVVFALAAVLTRNRS